MLSGYIAYLPLRLSTLTHYLAESLMEVRHDAACTPVARILSRTPGRILSAVGEQSDTGSTVSLVFLEVSSAVSSHLTSNEIDLEQPSGEIMSNSFIEYAATKNKISLRTGCMCNPGGAAAILGVEAEMKKFSPGITYDDFESIIGRELGVVRLSLGLVSDFSDVDRLLRFVREVVACDDERKKIWLEWKLHKQHHA
jgi:molybdenum cofactor sulfurtransferase